MSTNLSAQGEAVLAHAVACGMYADTTQALDEALRLLRRKVEIEEALIAGLSSGEPITVDDAFWEDKKAEIARRQDTDQP